MTRRTEALVVAAAEAHWGSPGDMVDAIEQLAIEAMVLAAEADGAPSTTWRTSCSGSAAWSPASRTCAPRWPISSLPAERKQALLNALLRRQGDPGVPPPIKPGGACIRAGAR